MDSTGGFLDALETGIIVAIKEITTATAIINPTVMILNCKIDRPISSWKDLSRKNWTTKEPITANKEQSAAMNNDSAKKILKTSLFLAPIALKIPISLFFEETETEMKLRSIKAAKAPKPTPTQKKMVFNIEIIETI